MMSYEEVLEFIHKKMLACDAIQAFPESRQIVLHFKTPRGIAVTLLIEPSRDNHEDLKLVLEKTGDFSGTGFGRYFCAVERAHSFIKMLMFSTDIIIPYEND